MDKIVEYKGYFGVKYERIQGNNSSEVMVAAILKKYKEFTYMMVIGTNQKVCYDTYKYLNLELEDKGFSHRELALRALKFLYSYLELFNTDIGYLNPDDKNKIITFLKGGKGNGQYITYCLETVRKNDTVNAYLGVYRSFFDFLGITDNIFKETKGLYRIIDSGNAYYSKNNSLQVQTYSMNLKEIKINKVPKYISYKEYLDILKVINDKYTLREKIIVKLMYEYGLRIGEVFGLTIEDIQGEEITKQKDTCRLILRNRFTDKPWQYAKGCMKITSPDEHLSDGYSVEGNGYQIIPISPTTYFLIQKYIDETTSPFSMSDKAYENYSKKNIADKVSKNDIYRNSYVFISKNYTPITGGAWNTIIKKIFQEVGLEIDKGKKINNLNHRFRHGFAMFKVLNEGFDELKLSYVLRHANTSSVKIYFNPTDTDLINFAIMQDKLTKRGLNL
ncbi:tyrosine-type recombinase/integrase [Psychrobacillus antarcticus]|uniref:tyrosine-type recombinase/integrase n=1 Tax=Psychrobacillus antarcticus TaxID=2879115 RepID=UPI002408536D|nr:site-specific integrase [Psychrobacillus antarcticus]